MHHFEIVQIELEIQNNNVGLHCFLFVNIYLSFYYIAWSATQAIQYVVQCLKRQCIIEFVILFLCCTNVNYCEQIVQVTQAWNVFFSAKPTIYIDIAAAIV